MPVSLDLRKAHKARRHGDLLAIYTWVNDERALVLLPAHRKAAAWFVVCESAAFRYDDPSVLAAQCVKACEVLGLEPSKQNWVRIASIIHEGLADLIRMPSAPVPEVGPSLGEIQLRVDGDLIAQTEIRQQRQGASYEQQGASDG